MSDWHNPLSHDGRLVAVQPEQLGDIPDDRFRKRECELVYIPIALTEIFVIGQSLPLSALETEFGFLLVAELRAGGMSATAFDKAGMWRLPYRPIALRLLPFVVQADGGVWRITNDSAASPPPAPTTKNIAPLQTALTTFSRSLATANKLLAMAVEGGMMTTRSGVGGEVVPLSIEPAGTTLTPAEAACCRLVEAMRFSQQAKSTSTSSPSRYPLQKNTRGGQGVRVEQLLSFDEAIMFRLGGTSYD